MSSKTCSGPCGRTLKPDAFYAGRARCRECYQADVRARRARVGRADRRPAAEVIADFVAASAGASTVPDVAPPPPRRWPSVEAFDATVEDTTAAPRIEIVRETITQVEEHRLKQEVSRLRSEVRSLTEQLSDAQAMHDIARMAAEAAADVPPIAARERTSGLLEATVQVLASDWHIEEEVRPEQVADRNRYNLDISQQRMHRFFQATRWGIEHTRQAFKVRDAILWLGGDLITNYLHDDNIESNLLAPVEAIAYADASITEGIKFLLQDPELERLVIPCNDGNHGRLTEKTRSATRVQNSIEWLLYTMLATKFKDEPRVQFIIAQGSQLYYEVYGRTIRYTHGDTTRYGGGVGGITIPIYKALARWDTVRRADLTVMGHYHQRTNLSDLIINGSLIGYSPYSLDIGARFEPPMQDLTVLDPRRWRSISMPLWVSERADDDRRVA